MSPVTFRKAVRENTLLVIGIAGPTKSGKTKSAHRLARGLAQGKPVAMINTEGPKGHQYADEYDYLAVDLDAPFRPEKYTEALHAAFALDPTPGVVIVDSASHMHDGPGGLLEWHDQELDKMSTRDDGSIDYAARNRKTWTAWIKPKAAENQVIYAIADAPCHVIVCFRAKEKLKIVTGRDPIDLGWQPIAGERVAFETIFTLILPPHCKGVPDLANSDMREPFDAMVPGDRPLNEETGAKLAEWAAGHKPTEMAAGKRRGLGPEAKQAAAEAKTLTTQLLDAATTIGKRDDFAGAISKHRGEHSADPAAHVEWLRRQLERVNAKVAESANQDVEL